MNVKAARRLARNLMIEHGLAVWRLDFMNHDSIAGLTTHSERKISLAVEYAQAYTPEQLTQLVLHEVAHALRGPATVSHDVKWLQTARRLGYLHGETMPVHYPRPNIRWDIVCPSTGEIHQTATRPDADHFCKLCNDPSCAPEIQRRQIVRQDVHNIPAPEHIYAPTIRRLKSFLRFPRPTS